MGDLGDRASAFFVAPSAFFVAPSAFFVAPSAFFVAPSDNGGAVAWNLYIYKSFKINDLPPPPPPDAILISTV